MINNSPGNGKTHPVVPKAISAEETKRLLNADPGQAEALAREALAGQADNPNALWLFGAALRRQGDSAAAKAVLQSLAITKPQMAAAGLEHGLALRDLGMHEEAADALRRTVDLAPNDADAWYALGDELEFIGNTNTESTPPSPASDHPQIRAASDALRFGRLDIAEKLIREFLVIDPENLRASKMLADTAFLLGRYADAGASLARCLELAPELEKARFQYAVTLLVQQRGHEAVRHIDQLLQNDSSNRIYRHLKATALSEIGEFGEAVALYQDILGDSPDSPGTWLAYGRALRGLGRTDECITALQKAIENLPVLVDAYWSLATVKSFCFNPALTKSLRALLAKPGLSAKDRAQLHFALGKALEDTGQYADSFDNYAKSNEFQRTGVGNRAQADASFVKRSKKFFTRDFFRQRAGAGCDATDPIFIVGLPRSGSTLIEQILSTHSAVEGLGELPDMKFIVAALDNEGKGAGNLLRYPEVLTSLEPGRFASLGEEYLRRTRPRRRLNRAFFTDKFLGNFAHIGLIQLMLPKAKIVDMRRHPLDCCLSCFKCYLPQSQTFYYTLRDLGHHYTNYVELIKHFDEVLPGNIHRVIYENLIDDPEREIRRLFDYLILPFEEHCLRFHERERAVTTLSSEQVRMPLYASGVGYWRKYEPCLGPLKEALGQVLDVYPDVPKHRLTTQYSMSIRLA